MKVSEFLNKFSHEFFILTFPLALYIFPLTQQVMDMSKKSVEEGKGSIRRQEKGFFHKLLLLLQKVQKGLSTILVHTMSTTRSTVRQTR